MKKNILLLVLALPLLALTLSSCNKKNVKGSAAGDNPDMTTETATIPGVDIQEGSETGGEGDIRGGEFLEQATIQTINFEYDRYELSEEARAALQANAALIKTRKDWTVLVEGHCDDRGTIEYNLALGQKRAKSVRDYYVRLGVADSAMGTISYGEEKPLCTEQTDACWLQNRRAETKIRGK
ncbi:MAG: peptidoglycan-associated lipoprotein [Elusimicrobia bacterium GWD2_63_28]|nr:MAG: peptidoglycan-associated lipoprotein [Elusimicrobia bacterium GWD2_63_28]